MEDIKCQDSRRGKKKVIDTSELSQIFEYKEKLKIKLKI